MEFYHIQDYSESLSIAKKTKNTPKYHLVFFFEIRVKSMPTISVGNHHKKEYFPISLTIGFNGGPWYVNKDAPRKSIPIPITISTMPIILYVVIADIYLKPVT